METYDHFVYMLRCKDKSLYTGYTIDLSERLKLHNEGKGAKYTRSRRPCQMVYIERFKTKSEALQREYAIKQLPRDKKVELIQNQLRDVMNHANSK